MSAEPPREHLFVVTYSPFDPEATYEAAIKTHTLSAGHLLHPSTSWEVRVAFAAHSDAVAYATSRNLELYVDTFSGAKLTATEVRDAERAATAACAEFAAIKTRDGAHDAPGAAAAYRHAFVTTAADIMQLKLTSEHTVSSVASMHPGGWRVHRVRGGAGESATPDGRSVFVVQEEPFCDPALAYKEGRYAWRVWRWFRSQEAADRAADARNVAAYVLAHTPELTAPVRARIAELVARHAGPPSARAAFEAALFRKAVRQLHATEVAPRAALLEAELRCAAGGCSVAAIALE